MSRLVALALAPSQVPAALRRAWDDGDAAMVVDPRWPPPARRSLLDALRPHVLVDEAGRRALPDPLPLAAGDALVVATSGTTGDPKGVVLTHDAVAAAAAAVSEALAVDPDRDRWLACLPLAHVGGLGVVTRALLTGTPLEVHERFDAAAVRQAAASGATLTALVPTALARVDTGGFRWVLLGGSAPPPAVSHNVRTTYGLTESGGGVVYDGVPLAGVEVRVVHGEVQLRGPMLLRTYRDGTDPKDPHGWLSTGDAGEWRDGRLVVHGRRGELIVTGGENVWPAPVEARLREHPGVREVLVRGRPDPEWGERVVAVVVPEHGEAPPSLEELRSWTREALPAYAAPRELELVDSLARTPLGKVRR